MCSLARTWNLLADRLAVCVPEIIRPISLSLISVATSWHLIIDLFSLIPSAKHGCPFFVGARLPCSVRLYGSLCVGHMGQGLYIWMSHVYHMLIMCITCMCAIIMAYVCHM